MALLIGKSGFPDVNKTSFQEEQNLNDPTHSYQWVMDNYRKTYNPTLGYGLYEWEDITFANTETIQRAAQYFQKYGRYVDIDENKDPYHWNQWWDREEYRRVHGITLPLKVPPGGTISDKDLLPLWIPGPMYGQLNYGPIKRVKDLSSPSVDDILASGSIESAHSKHNRVTDLFKGLSAKEVKKKELDFPDFWDGHFHTWISMGVARNLGNNLSILKSRRKGFSYIGAWDAFNHADMNPNVTIILVAFDLKYLNKGRGLFVMVKEYSDHINTHTAWAKRRIKDTETELKFGFKYNKSKAIGGYRSEIIAVSAADNPDVVRGKDPDKILWEECGTFPNLLQAVEATEAALEAGSYSTGNSQYWGTVGSKEADYHGLSMLFYSPAGYNCLPFRNKYDKNPVRPASSMFFSIFQNFEGSMNKDGNSNETLAREIFEKQKAIKKNNSRTSDFEAWLAERASTPEEALSRKANNLFSRHSDDIVRQVQIIEHDPLVKAITRHGKYERIKDKVMFVSNDALKERGSIWYPPIDDLFQFLPKDISFHGCITEWDVPYVISRPGVDGGIDTFVPDNLYYGWHDPYATDKNTKDITMEDSLGVCYIYEAVNSVTPGYGDRIVARWAGRPDTVVEYNDQLFMLLERWNAKMMFENDRGDVIPYAREHKLFKYLMEEPEMLSLKEYNIQGKTGRNYGVSIQKHPNRKNTAATLYRDKLGSINSRAADGTARTFISNIYCKLLLRQTLGWNKDGNFDAVSAAFVGMFQIKETLELEVKAEDPNASKYDSDFWNRNFFD